VAPKQKIAAASSCKSLEALPILLLGATTIMPTGLSLWRHMAG
jgi:hypothetical protein